MSDSGDAMAIDLEPLILEFGKAVYICQAFESSLCLLHAMMTHEETGGQEEAFTASWDFHSTKTLGQTVNALRKRIVIPADLNDYLEEGVKETLIKATLSGFFVPEVVFAKFASS